MKAIWAGLFYSIFSVAVLVGVVYLFPYLIETFDLSTVTIPASGVYAIGALIIAIALYLVTLLFRGRWQPLAVLVWCVTLAYLSVEIAFNVGVFWMMGFVFTYVVLTYMVGDYREKASIK